MKTAVLGKLLMALFPALVFIPLFISFRLTSKAVPAWADWSLAFGSAALMAINPLVVHSTSSRKRWVIFIVGFFGWVAFFVLLALIIMGVVFGDGV